MAGLDTLNITNSGFFNINKKIINSRVFSNSLITVIGKPSIADGIASSFSSNNFLTYSPLKFKDTESITINFKGTYSESEHEQCAWELIDSDGNTLTLSFENSRVTLIYKRSIIFSFNNLKLTNEQLMSAFLTLKKGEYEFTLNYGKEVVQKTEALGFLLPLETFSILNLGSSSLNRGNFWTGSIDLKKFSIYNNRSLLYSPSVGTTWNFSHIIVSDGSFPLNDETKPVLNSIYKFPVNEITKSGNSTLLTCSIDEDAYLTIREIGLYIQTPSGQLLFGYINNLNISKVEGLPYDLVFTINTTVSVMNAIGFPAENGIVVKDPDSIEFKNYTTVQQVNTYVLTNLERMIRMNAGAKGSYSYINSSVENNQAGIGHNRPQVIYRLQQEIESNEDCYNSIDTFTKLTNRFRELYERQVNYDILEAHGGIRIPENGKTSGFNNSKYITSNTSFTNTASWQATISFSNQEGTQGSILSLASPSPITPLELKIENDNCHLKIHSLESIEPTNANSFYSRSPSRDTQDNGINYYAWTRNNDSTLYNFHCPGLNMAASPILSFPQISTVCLEHEDFSAQNFKFSTRVMFNSITGTQYIIGKPYASSENSSFEILLENGKLKAYLYKESTGELIGEPLSTIYNLKPNQYYTISLSYENKVYSLEYETTTQGYSDHEIDSMFSLDRISLNSENVLVIGNRYLTQELPLSWAVPSKSAALQNETWTALTFGTKLVALSKRGYTATSTDGTTWTAGGTIMSTSQSTPINWSAIAYGNNKYVALSEGGYISTSTNGTTWSIATSVSSELAPDDVVTAEPFKWVALTYGKVSNSLYLFYAFSINGGYAESTDGITWHYLGSGDPKWVSATYGNNKFLALDKDGNIYAHTPTGSGWPRVGTLDNQYEWSALSFLNNQYVAFSKTGEMSLSDDGTSWSTPVKVDEMNLQNDEWISLASTSSKLIALSKKGLTSTTPGNSLKGSIDFSNMTLTNSSTSWIGASEISLIYSKSAQPTDNSSLYDDNFEILQNSVATSYEYATILDDNLFTVEPSKKYTLNISYIEDEDAQQGRYEVDYITDDNALTKKTLHFQLLPIANNLSNRMGMPTITYIGIDSNLENPFNAPIWLLGSGVWQEDNEWPFGPLVNVNSATLLQYYRMPSMRKNQYTVRDICNLSRTIRFLSNKFESNEDSISTSYDKGLTLCTKVDLQDTNSKVILYKSNLVDDIYFSLTFIDQTLAFTMLTSDGTMATVSKKLALEEYDAYIKEPLMLTVTLTPQYDNWYYLQLCKNNEPITESKYIQIDKTVNPSTYVLSNYIGEMPTYTILDEDGQQITKTIEPGKYISDMIVIEGAIKSSDLFYINNLFDTNF